MNIREGMRRLGLAMGILCMVAGSWIALTKEQEVWEARATCERFESQDGSLAIQKIRKAMAAKEDPTRLFPQKRSSGEYTDEDVEGFYLNGLYPNLEVVLVGMDGIDRVDIADGIIVSVVYSNGSRIDRPKVPGISAYLPPILYPIIGFLIPWAAIKMLAWIVTGFVK